MLRTIFKIAAWVIGIILLLFAIVWIALQIPSVQNRIVQQATKVLSETLDTEVSIGKVDIDFFKTLVVENVYIESQEQDTLAFVRRVGVDISARQLLNNHIEVKQLEIDGLKTNLYRAQADSLFNYQFIIDAFAPSTPVDTTTTTTAWTFGISEVYVTDTYFRMLDEFAYNDTEVYLDELEFQIGNLDLEEQLVDIDLIRLKDSDVRYSFLKRPEGDILEIPEPEIIDSTANDALAFPDFGWRVYLNRLSFVDNHIVYEDENSERIENAMDFAHLNIQDLNIELRDWQMLPEKIKGKIKTIAFRDHSGFELEDVKVGFLFTPEALEINAFQMETPQSQFQADAYVDYVSLESLTNNIEEEVEIEARIKRSELAFKDLEYFAPAINEIKQLNTSADKVIYLDARMQGTLADMRDIEVDFSVDDDLILRANGSAQHLMNPDELAYDIRLQRLATSYRKLNNLIQDVPLPKGLDTLGRTQLSGRFLGSMNDLQGIDIRLMTQAYTRFQGHFYADHLTDGQNIAFDVNITELRTQGDELNAFVEGGVPPEVKRLGKVYYSGQIEGDIYNISSVGELRTEAGNVTTDAQVAFNNDYSDAEYSGDLALQEFDLGYILQDTTIGNVSLTVNGAGSGLAIDSLQAELDGEVIAFDYQGYEYHDLKIDGVVKGMEFIGEASFEDPNLAFNFEGDINLNDSIPDLQFTMLIDTVNFANLNFKDIPYAFSGDIYSNFSGNNLDNIEGSARIENIYLSNDTASVATDSIIFLATEEGTGRGVELHSEFFNLVIRGQYNIAELPTLVINYVNDYFPVDQLLSPVDTPDSLAIEPNEPAAQLPDQNFTATLGLANPLPLINIFFTGIEELDTASMVFTLDTKAKNIQLIGNIPLLAMQGNTFSNINLNMEGTPDFLQSRLSVEDIDYGMDKPISVATIGIDMGNDSLLMSVEALESLGDSSLTKIALNGLATRTNERYRLTFGEDFVLNGETWQVSDNNEILYRPNILNVNNLRLEKGEQALVFNTEDETRDQDFAPVRLGFENFQLSEIFNFINMEEAEYAGEINGGVTVRDYTGNLNYLADIDINNITLEGQAVGDLSVKASQDGQSPIINVDAILDGEKGEFSGKGTYEITTETFDLRAEMDDLELALIDPFMNDLIRDSRGELNGTLNITGTPTAPEIEGTIGFDSISTVLGLAGVRYNVNGEELNFDNGDIDFGTFNLSDENGNNAVLSGTMNISDLEDIAMDLNFSTSRFQVLNTTSEDEELYYGTLMVSADVDINGTALKPVIDMSASTLEGTQLFVQPLTVEAATASQRDFIIFADPEVYLTEDSTRTLNEVYQLNEAGIDLTLNLEVTPEAELQIVIDPATGDKLVCRGVAEMTVDMRPSGEVDVLGNYRITDGQYSLNYQGLLKKDFVLKPDSRLDFVGDPLDTRFDISAIYTAQTPTFELIRNRLTDENSAEALAAKRRTDVEVVMNMRGDLNEPAISFDIQVPESGDGVTNVTRQELQRLRDNPTELNKQVFSLLLLGSFISQQSGGGGIADAGRSVALSSVSSLLTNQLNRLADNYVKGVDISIGVDSYQSDYDLGDAGNTITELNLGVSKRFLDDRLSIQVGGNVNVNSQSALVVEGANFSSIAGDFVLEYRLTPAGNYRLRVFRRENYDVLNQDNSPQTGVGLNFTKAFGDVSKGKNEEEDVNIEQNDD